MRKTPSAHLSQQIACDYACWTVQSAFRQGPVRSRKGVQALLKAVDFSTVLDSSKGPISATEFEAWHAASVKAILGTPDMVGKYGWAAKALNVYLKTTSYVGSLGRKGLVAHLHPPIDSGLWNGLAQRFAGNPALVITHQVRFISGIQSATIYMNIISGMRQLAKEDNCLLIELEQYWLNALSAKEAQDHE